MTDSTPPRVEPPGRGGASPRTGDALRYDTDVDLNDRNTARTQLVLLTGSEKKVLEFGPATGYITKALSDRGCRVTAIEIDPKAAAEAERFADRMIVGDIETLDLGSVLGGERFDVVMFGDVLEHLVDPARILATARSMLTDGGSVVASIPNIAHGSVRLALLSGSFPYSSQGLLDRTHLRFFTRESLERLFQGTGFDIVEWGRTTADVFETELELDPRSYPADLVEIIRAMPESETYQFVVRAELSDRSWTSVSAPMQARPVGRALQPMWRLQEKFSRLEAELGEKEALIQSKQRVIDDAERVTERRERRLREFEVRLRELDGVLRETEAELERTRASGTFRAAQKIRRWFPPATIRGWLLSRMGRLVRRRMLRKASVVSSSPESNTPIVSGVAQVTPPAYQAWIDRHERSREDLLGDRHRLAHLPYQPLISIVVPTWRPDPGQLNHMLESVLDQTYERWELCIADGGSDMEVRRLLSRFKAGDERIKVRFLEENLGITGNTTECLSMAAGEFVAFVDQTDVLAPGALAQVAERLNRDPSIDVVYSDWDLLSEDGKARFNPYFTPEWSPDLLLSANYMTHLSVVRRRLIDEVGGLRYEFDGAQDWDLLLRVTERTDRVARIPGILYHWRADPSSAALTLRPKPAAEEAQRRSVQEHLDRMGSSGTIVRTSEGDLRIRWSLRDRPMVSIIIPTKHNRELLERCLTGIDRSSYREREVVVIETAERTPDREAWYQSIGERFRLRVLWWERAFNYSAVNNFAAGHAAGDVLVFLNDDTEPLTDDWIEEIVGWLQRDGVGVVGAQLLAEDGSIQHGGVAVGMQGFAEHLFRGLEPDSWTLLGSSAWYRNMSAVTGACLGITRDVFDGIGGWDERFVLCGSDVELCLRAWRSGLRVVVDPYARLRHIERATRGSSIPQSDFCVSLWHYQRHLYGGDPFFNPNLSYQEPIPRLLRSEEQSSLQIVSEVVGRDVRPRLPGDEQRDAPALVEALTVDPSDMEAIRSLHAAVRGRQDIRSVTWFIPDFENPFYGGIHTIFRFADRLHRAHGVENRFVVTGTGPEEFIRSGLTVTFPNIAHSDIFVMPGGSDQDLRQLPSSDAAICTLWVTAYPMAGWRGAKRYFSFVQDFEPMFYPAGALFALAEETYRMGFYGIANSPPLKDIFESYGGRAQSFVPCIDPEIFHPDEDTRSEGDPLTVFMYARPGHPRNCYELAVSALRRLKESMGERVRIATAGSWSSGETEPWLDQLGFLGYRETADLYRRCDAGLVLSVSKHPTYIPLQLMACGSLVVANDNPANGWLLRDGENALLADPTPDALASALRRGLEDSELRARLTKQAALDIGEHHSDWAVEIDRIYRFMCDPDGPGASD